MINLLTGRPFVFQRESIVSIIRVLSHPPVLPRSSAMVRGRGDRRRDDFRIDGIQERAGDVDLDLILVKATRANDQAVG